VPGRDVGTPFAVAASDGPVSVFVRNGSGGVSRSAQGPDGTWGPWVDLGGSDVQDGLTAFAGPDGVELYASTTTKVLRWHGDWDATFPSVVPAAGPVVLRDHVIYRVASSGEVAISQRGPSGWMPPVLHAGPGGPGQVAAVSRDGLLTLVGRDATGKVTVARETPGGLGPWTARAADTVDYPTVVPDGSGVLALAIGPDGKLATDPLT
jgi:hypothetical protein